MKKILRLILMVWLMVITGCRAEPPILVGFSGQLTGKYSDLGVQGRNGAQLAVEMLNEGGGIHGRRLALIAGDDTNTPEGARKNDLELLGRGVVAIIGHTTSAMSVAALPAVEAAGGILISPTTSTSYLTGKKDGFFRVVPDIVNAAAALAEHVYSVELVGRLGVLQDLDNGAYSNVFAEAFIARYQALGGAVAGRWDFSSGANPSWEPVLSDIRRLGPQRVLAICSAKDLAALARNIHIGKLDVGLVSAPWAYTKEIVQTGGNTVDGILFTAFYADDCPQAPFLAFKKRYEGRFGVEPNFSAAFGYEAVLTLAEGLKITGGKAAGLRDALTGLQDIKGVMGTFSLDGFGDVQRPVYLATIRQGRFVTLGGARN